MLCDHTAVNLILGLPPTLAQLGVKGGKEAVLNSLMVEGRSPNRGRQSARQDRQVVMQDNKYTEVPFAPVRRRGNTVAVRDATIYECSGVGLGSLLCRSPASEHTVEVAREHNSFRLRSYNLRGYSFESNPAPIDPLPRLGYDEEKAGR